MPVKSPEGVYTFIFLLFLKKKKKAGEVTTFFVFSGTSHLFNLYLYYKRSG